MTDQSRLDEIAIEQDRKRLFVLYADLKSSASKSWLVHQMLGQGEASTFYGAPGCGKGVIIEDMCLHISAGREWHGRPVTRGAVVYVALERKKLVERRAIAFRKKHGLLDLPFAIVGGVHDFRDPATALHIADICNQVAELTAETVVLIVIDTLSRALAGGDENSPKDMGAVVNSTARLQEKTKAHVLWVHHMPHDGDRMRGHGALLGAMDTTLHVVKSVSGRTATVVKANDSEEGECIAFELESIEIGEDGTTAPVVVPIDAPSIRPQSARRVSPRQRLALNALTETVLACGKPAPTDFGLPANINVVPIESWRDEMQRRDVIESTDANPRATFKRFKEGLAARGLIGIKEGSVWAA
jgi:AAA domain